jgi:hypothetical protein
VKFIGFDNREHTLSITDYIIYDDDTKSKSELHIRARKILKSLFPCDKILEEITLPGSKKNGSILYADFFIPKKMLMVEVHGRQHYEYVPFFHSTKLGFIKSKLRDSDKREWCDINGIELVELPYNKSDEEWRSKIELR